METKFKSKIPDKYQKFGIYFKSENDITTEYLIEFLSGKSENNAIVKIYTTDVLCNYFKTDGLVNGNIIGLPEHETQWIADVDLWGKYFFPKFNNDLQLYYDEEKYYGQKTKTNSITSLMECINYAIEYGLNKSGIKPY
jgi:hypothetical protein